MSPVSKTIIGKLEESPVASSRAYAYAFKSIADREHLCSESLDKLRLRHTIYRL